MTWGGYKNQSDRDAAQLGERAARDRRAAERMTLDGVEIQALADALDRAAAALGAINARSLGFRHAQQHAAALAACNEMQRLIAAKRMPAAERDSAVG